MPSDMPLFIKIARVTYGKLLKASRKISFKNDCGANLKQNPYLILSNYAGKLDPVVISTVFPQHIRWSVEESLFETKFSNKVLGDWCKSIPKHHGQNYITTLRSINNALNQGDNVGIFPEGTRTWDGEIMPINYVSLAKMIRMFKVPVLFVHLEGAFAQDPRWADKRRHGPIVVNIKYKIDPLEFSKMDIPTLAALVKKYLFFSNDQWKETVDYKYTSHKRAEGLQQFLYLCPRCKAVDSLRTEGNRVVCKKCNTNTVLNDKDNLTSIDVPFTKLSQWHKWQAKNIGKVKQFPEERGVLLKKGDANNTGDLEELSTNFTIQLKDDALHLKHNKETIDLPLEKISSFVLTTKQTMNLFCGQDLYRIRLLPKANLLKYQEYYQAYKVRTKTQSAQTATKTVRPNIGKT